MNNRLLVDMRQLKHRRLQERVEFSLPWSVLIIGSGEGVGENKSNQGHRFLFDVSG